MTRQHIVSLIALLALLGSCVAMWATVIERDDALRGYVDATQNPSLPFRLPRFGVNAELTQYSQEELVHQFDLMKGAHITWVRQMFRWDEIEPQPGQYHWDKWDAVIATLRQYPELDLIAVLVNTPLWARQPGSSANAMTTPPADATQYAHFAQAVAQRYGESIDYYQIWDEPNLKDAWGGNEPRPVEYANLLEAAYRAIRGADENANVIAAALAPTTESGPDNISDIQYLRDLYALGIQNFTDGIAAKPVGFSLPATNRVVDRDILNFSRIIALREEMIRNGDEAKPLWASSFGWNALPDNWTGAPSIWGRVSLQQQADFTIGALDRADREWPWLAGMILSHWQPTVSSDNPLWGFAVIDEQDQPTLLWQALSVRAPALAAQNGLFPANTVYARYSGVWRFSELGADVGWLDDSQVDFEFTGADIALLLRQDDYVAYLYPTIDGQQANAIPRDAAGNGYIVLTSNSREPELELVPIAHGLGDGVHTLHLTADRGQQRWALVGFAVSSGDMATPFNRQLVASLFTIVCASVGLAVSGWKLDWKWLLMPIAVTWQRLTDTGQLLLGIATSVALMIGMLVTWGDSTPNLLRREPVQIGAAILTSGLLYLQPGLILTIVSAIVLFIIFYDRPDLGLTLTLFWSPFFLFPVELYQFAIPLSEMLILTTAAAWLLRGLYNWGRYRQATISQYSDFRAFIRRCRLNPIDCGVLGWALLGVISLSWAERMPQARTELRVMIVEPVLFYFIFRTVCRDKAKLIRVVDTMLLAGFIVAFIGLWLFVRDEAVITAESGARRLASVYGSPNNIALFLGRCIPVAFAYLIVKTDRPRQITAGIILVVMALALLFTQSVGAIYLGMPSAIAAVLLLVWRKRGLLAIGALIAGISAISPFVFQSARFARVFDFTSGTNFFRIRVWQSAINAIRDHPLLGLGLDQFLYAFRGQYIMPDAWQEPNLSHPHNFILDFWVRLGILGVVGFFWLQIAFWRAMRSVYLYYRTKDPLYFALSVGVIGSMVNLLSHGLVDNSVFVQDLCYVYVLLLGLAANVSNIRTIDESAKIMV